MPTTTRTYRLPDELLERIAAYKARLEELAGVTLSETQAIVSLLRKGLDQADTEVDGPAVSPAKKPTKPRR